MQVKRIYVEAKKSQNFQTYTVGMDIDIDEDFNSENLEEQIKACQAKCRRLCREQITIDTGK